MTHLAEGRHKYIEVRVLGANVVLCDFYRADFWSYKPSYFVRGRGYQPGKDMVFVRDILEKPAKDWYCPECKRRLAFLRFVAEVRDGAPERL